MAEITAGIYTVREVFDIADFDFEVKAAAEHLNGEPDFRTVQVGGLAFDDLDKKLAVPASADTLVITVNGEADTTLDVVED